MSKILTCFCFLFFISLWRRLPSVHNMVYFCEIKRLLFRNTVKSPLVSCTIRQVNWKKIANVVLEIDVNIHEFFIFILCCQHALCYFHLKRRFQCRNRFPKNIKFRSRSTLKISGISKHLEIITSVIDITVKNIIQSELYTYPHPSVYMYIYTVHLKLPTFWGWTYWGIISGGRQLN